MLCSGPAKVEMRDSPFSSPPRMGRGFEAFRLFFDLERTFSGSLGLRRFRVFPFTQTSCLSCDRTTSSLCLFFVGGFGFFPGRASHLRRIREAGLIL